MTVVFVASGAHMSVLKLTLICYVLGEPTGSQLTEYNTLKSTMFKAFDKRAPDR